ncbi:MAG: amidohydrolase family protein, partial [Myxococcota bacterium]
MLICNAEIEGVTGLDLRIENGHIQEIGSGIKRKPGEANWDAGGGGVIPGLHDHHIHLYALAAAEASTPCGPPEVRTASDLAEALARACRRAQPGGWVRGIG